MPERTKPPFHSFWEARALALQTGESYATNRNIEVAAPHREMRRAIIHP